MAVVRAFPVFSKGNILRQEMLLALSGYTELGDLMFEEYGNGILRGCKLTTTKEAIQVGRGVVVYDGKLLMIKEPLRIPYSPTDTLCACKLHFSVEHTKNNVVYQEVEATITQDVEAHDGEIELCRFKLQPGAMLRSNYVDFEDRNTEYDTLNTIHCPFSVLRGSTLNLDVLKAFANELMMCSPVNIIDQVFCMQVFGTQVVLPLDSISNYISLRTKNKLCLSNEKCYESLLKIILSIRQGNDPTNEVVKRSQWRITME